MREEYVNEPVTVQLRAVQRGRPMDAGAQPVAFRWRGHTYSLAGLGRQWEEEDQDQVRRCFLAETANGDIVDLRWSTDTDQWRLWRIWRRSVLA